VISLKKSGAGEGIRTPDPNRLDQHAEENSSRGTSFDFANASGCCRDRFKAASLDPLLGGIRHHQFPHPSPWLRGEFILDKIFITQGAGLMLPGFARHLHVALLRVAVRRIAAV
jgi:hypothetical protein